MTKLEIKNVNRRQFVTGAAALGLGTLSGCTSPRSKSFDAQIIILGAGLSGLHAARLLESEGRDVLVVEGSTRIGGRVQTLRHAGGAYTEAGGEQVGATYARLRDTAEQLDIQLTADSPARRGTSYAFEGKTYSAEAWSKLTDHPFSPPFKGASPTSPLFRLAARNNPLKNADDWQLESFTPFDMSAREFLSRNGFETAAQDIIGHTLNGNNLDTYSMMNLYRSLQIYTQSLEAGPSMSIAGGAQRLPEAMAASLSRDVMTNFMVSRIEVADEAITITDKSGRRLKAEQCICALPFGALRNIDISAPLSPPQRDAIKGLAYTQILQLHFKVGQPYWETDGLPPDMWMDGPLERIFINHDASGNPTPSGRAWINGDAAAKLDMHLGGYSSAVHAAVSRLSSPPNPRKSPEHLWRRVHDRLGFFHDENQHAQRLVNVGMSWAYWHLEMNAICLASAQLLTEQSRLTDRAADDHGRVDAGSVVALAGAPRPPCDDPTDDHANSLAIAAGGASAGPPRAPDCQDNCDSDGGGDAEGGAGFNEEYVLSKVFERQLSLKPSVTAVTVIKSLVALLTGRDDSPDVCRRLLTDSLLLFTRNHHSSASDKEAATEMLWTRLGTVLSKWWAVWEAPGNAPSVPPPGTAAHKRFAGQPTKSSRWCYSVDMTDANEILAASGVPDSRFFHKSKLSTVEEVERTAPKDKPRLPVAVAAVCVESRIQWTWPSPSMLPSEKP
mgnify:CR=1 FL=1